MRARVLGRITAATIFAAHIIAFTGLAFAQQAPPPSAAAQPAAVPPPPSSPPAGATPSPTPPPGARPLPPPPAAPPGAPGAAPMPPGAQPYPPPYAGQPYPYPYPYPYGPWGGYDGRPKELEYDGGTVPAGYHKVEEPRRGLAIAGGAVFGGTYSIMLFGALASGYAPLAIPVAGPFVLMAETSGFESLLDPLLIIDGVAKAAGVVMLIAGLASKKTVLMRDDVTAFKPEVLIGPGSVGMRMSF